MLLVILLSEASDVVEELNVVLENQALVLGDLVKLVIVEVACVRVVGSPLIFTHARELAMFICRQLLLLIELFLELKNADDCGLENIECVVAAF